MLELFLETASDGSSDESMVDSPVTSSIVRPANPSFNDTAFPFSVDESDYPSVPETGETSVVPADTLPDQSGHASNVRKQPLKRPRPILKRSRPETKEVDPSKFVHKDKQSRRFDADGSPPRSGSPELPPSFTEGSSMLSGTNAPSTRGSVRFASSRLEYADDGKSSRKETEDAKPIPIDWTAEELNWTPSTSCDELDSDLSDEESKQAPPRLASPLIPKPAYKQRRAPVRKLTSIMQQLEQLDHRLWAGRRLSQWDERTLSYWMNTYREVRGQIISASQEDPQVTPTIRELQRFYQDVYAWLEKFRETCRNAGYDMGPNDEEFRGLKFLDSELRP